MALPKLIDESHIKDLESKRDGALNRVYQSYEKQITAADPLKERWLAIYAHTLSPSLACKQADVSMDTYQRWRKTDPSFCRGLNKCVSAAHDELRGSILVRATGYLRNDPETGEIERDAVGKPIYHGGSDVLAKALHQQDNDTATKTSPVSITINTGAFWGDDPAIVVERPSADVIEHQPDEAD